MTAYKKALLEQFKQMAIQDEQTLSIKEGIFQGKDTARYSVNYSPKVASFIANVTGMDLAFIKQFIFVNQIYLLVSDYFSFDVKVCLTINENICQLDFRPAADPVVRHNLYEFDLSSFITVTISDNLVMSYYCSQFQLINANDYEMAYGNRLKYIQFIIGDPFVKLKTLLKNLTKSTRSVVDERLKDSGFKSVAIEDFISMYGIEDSVILNEPYVYKSIGIGVTPKILNNFFDKYSPPLFADKMKNIISLAYFQEKLLNREIATLPLNYKKDITISFKHMSKYTHENKIYMMAFGATPSGKSRYTFFFYDTGRFTFCGDYDVVYKELNNVDDIYDYIKEEFIKNLEKHLEMDRREITLKHLEIFKMMVI